MDSFLLSLPKVELHAHLNGSLKVDSMRELGETIFGAHTEEFKTVTRELDNFAPNNNADLRKWFEKFKFVHQLTATRCGLEAATMLAIRDFEQDNIMYLELRTTPKTNEHMNKREYLECVLGSMKKAATIYTAINVKLLPSIDRGQSVAEAEETLRIVQELRHEWPQIVGIDFSGHPSVGKFHDFAIVLQQARDSGLKLALHCAEIENPAEIDEMVKFGMNRCGHGTFLNESQLNALHLKKTAIECCLSSNVKSQTVPSLEDHHFKRIFSSVKDVALCTDDCGVFDTTLTQEYKLAVETFNLSKEDIYRLAKTAVDYAFAEEVEKLEMHKKIEKYFQNS